MIQKVRAIKHTGAENEMTALAILSLLRFAFSLSNFGARIQPWSRENLASEFWKAYEALGFCQRSKLQVTVHIRLCDRL